MLAAIGSTSTAARSSPCSASTASSAVEVVVRHDDRVGDGAGCDAGRTGQPERRDPAPGRDEQRVEVPVVAAGELHDLRPAVAPRASRTAVIAASVPDDTSRTFSTLGTRSQMASASSTSRVVGAPNDVPSSAAALHRLDDRGMRRDRGSTRPTTARSRRTRCPRCRRGTRPGRARRRTGSPPTDPKARTGELTPPGMRACARSYQLGIRLGHEFSWTSSATSRAKYVSTKSAPARLIARQVLERDRGRRRSSRARAAAFTIAYSPLTWYAATGTSNASRIARDHVEVGQRGLHHHHVGALVDVERDLGDAPRARWRRPSGSRGGRRTAARTRPRRGTVRSSADAYFAA